MPSSIPVLRSTGDTILEALSEAGILPTEVKYILLTHGHPDHAGSAAQLRRVTGAKVVSHALDAEIIESEDSSMLRQLLFAARLTSSLGASSYAQGASAAAVAAGPDSIKVTVTGIRSSKGRVRVELWSSEVGFPRQNEHAAKTVWIDATQVSQGTVTTTFDSLQTGSYAIAAMHDENNNGKLDTGAFGIPKEGWAVSNNVTSHTHPPKFEDAKIQVKSPDQKTALNLHY